jgi:putative transcriptional regulator
MAKQITRPSITPERRAGLLSQVDWDRVNAKTDEEIKADIAADPDAATPLTDAQAIAMRVQYVRHQTGLSQGEFATRFKIPKRTLQDWEQARREPDAAALAYLRVIERHPEAVVDALETA